MPSAYGVISPQQMFTGFLLCRGVLEIQRESDKACLSFIKLNLVRKTYKQFEFNVVGEEDVRRAEKKARAHLRE